MFITADQVLAHMVGDYALQSDWMANEKTKRSLAAFVHVAFYSLPWLLLTTNWRALAIITGTHFIIDRWRLARHVGWIKNWLAPPSKKPLPWAESNVTGYDPGKPVWMSVWLMIIVDQIMHVCCNGLALRLFP